MNANETITYLKDLLLYYLDELKSVGDLPQMQFAYGEKTAYVECLEILQLWDDASRNGLNFDVEKKYPL